MSKYVKVFLVLTLIAALLPTIPAAAKPPQPPQPPPSPLVLEPNWGVQPAIPTNCQLGSDPNGSQTLICVPDVGWLQLQATVIIFAHGYVNPYFPAKTIPWDQMTLTDPVSGARTFLPTLVTNMGYYFATTSYRANGLVVQDAIQDLLAVRSMALPKMRALVKTVVLAGVSEGGLITALSIERYSSSYYGGLALCGPYGDFQKQVNYWGDFRTLYDAYFPFRAGSPPGLPPDAVNIPTDLVKNWYGDGGTVYNPAYRNAAAGEFMNSDNIGLTAELLENASTPVESLTNPLTIQDTVLGLLDYNIYATENGKQLLGGNPFDNRRTDYPDSILLGKDLDQLVTRYTAGRKVATNIAKYQTTGNLGSPLVVMHTSGDPIVPAWHVADYQAKVAAQGRLNNFSAIPVTRYGHCAFTESEIMAGFDILYNRATGLSAPTRDNLLSGQALENYDRLMKEDKEKKQ